MKKKYREIFHLATPFYNKGRMADKLHHAVVAKMMQGILREKPNLDQDVLMAAAVLHDIGYAKMPKAQRRKHWLMKVKKAHMVFGAQLAERILRKVKFPPDKIMKVVAIISTHDNPELGLPVTVPNAKILKEADILWMTTEEAFWLDIGRRMADPEEWLKVLEKRFTKEKEYTDYLKTKFARRKVRIFLRSMRKKIGVL